MYVTVRRTDIDIGNSLLTENNIRMMSHRLSPMIDLSPPFQTLLTLTLYLPRGASAYKRVKGRWRFHSFDVVFHNLGALLL